MKRWRTVPIYMAAMMAVLSPTEALAASSPEFAHTAEEWERLRDNKLEYDEIEGLVHEYNPVVLNNRLSYNTSDYKNKTSNEIADMMRDAANAARNASVDGMEDAMADMMSNSMEAQAKSLEKQADSNTMDDQVIRLQYEMQEKILSSTVQSLLNQYNQMLYNKEMMTQNRELLDMLYNSTVTRMGLGMATQADVLDASQKLQALDAQIINLDNGITGLRQNLCLMTGWSYDALPELGTIPAADLTRIDAMNLDTDIANAVENNYGLRISRRQLENTSSSYADTEILKKTISNNEQTLATNVTKQYQAVIKAKADLEEASAALNLETKNMNTAQVKYQLGSIGKLEYQQAKVAFATQQATYAQKDMLLFQAMETYDWMLRGVSSN